MLFKYKLDLLKNFSLKKFSLKYQPIIHKGYYVVQSFHKVS